MDVKMRLETEKTATEKELTDKFLSGEISFAEYSERWAGEGFGEEDEEPEGEVEAEAEPGQEFAAATRTRRNRRRKQLPAALSGLMGEANLCYARGNYDMAEKMCYEIIRQMPTAAEPFQTLAQLYESDPEKSLQFNLLAAHLNPSDAERWIKVAGISKERGDMKQEIFCYTKAINANPQHVPYHMMRLELVKTMEEKKIMVPGNITTQICQLRLIGCMSDADGESVLSIAKEVAQAYHSKNEIKRACNAMDRAYKRFSNLFTLEDINLYLELLISLKDYNKCMHIFVEKCDIEIEEEIQPVVDGEYTENTTRIVNCAFPDVLPIDIRTKFIICLIHLKNYHLIDTFIENMIETEDVETTGDIYLDIEEALTSEGCYEMALQLLKVLVQSTRYSLPAVWLKYAECLSALDKKLEAIVAYKTVVNLAPQHLDARIKLSMLLKNCNRMDEALEALEQDEYTDIIYTSLLYERCLILKNLGRKEEYLKIGFLLLSRHCFTIRHRMELNVFRIRDTADNLRDIRKTRGENLEEPNAPVFDDSNTKITTEIEWNILQDLFKIAYELRDYCMLERMAFSTLGSKRFQEYRTSLEFSCLLACYYNKNYFYAFNIIRDFIMKSPETIGMWNTFNLIIQKSDSVRQNKFLMRFLRRDNSYNNELCIFNANNCLLSGSYKYALKEYVKVYKATNSSLSALLCGITMIHIVGQKHSTNKHGLVTQSFAFLSYYEKLRGPDGRQETLYNLGRAYHHLGLIYMACKYYKQALEVDVELINSQPDVLDLRKEIAYNLHLIYKDDAPDLAQMYLEKYIVI